MHLFSNIRPSNWWSSGSQTLSFTFHTNKTEIGKVNFEEILTFPLLFHTIIILFNGEDIIWIVRYFIHKCEGRKSVEFKLNY